MNHDRNFLRPDKERRHAGERRGPLPADALPDEERRLARGLDRRSRENRQFVSFTIQGQQLAVPVADALEILLPQTVAPVPGGPSQCAGLINLRGQVLTVMHLPHILGFTGGPSPDDMLHLIVHGEDGPASLLIDSIGDVLTVARHLITPPPETFNAGIRRYIAGLARLDQGLLMVLDVPQVLGAAGSGVR